MLVDEAELDDAYYNGVIEGISIGDKCRWLEKLEMCVNLQLMHDVAEMNEAQKTKEG